MKPVKFRPVTAHSLKFSTVCRYLLLSGGKCGLLWCEMLSAVQWVTAKEAQKGFSHTHTHIPSVKAAMSSVRVYVCVCAVCVCVRDRGFVFILSVCVRKGEREREYV